MLMRDKSKRRMSAVVVPSLLAGMGLLVASCASNVDGESLTPSGSVGGVQRLAAPGARSQYEINVLNTYRAQAFSAKKTTNSAVNHSNILYTSAFRHSVYVNTVNSANWNQVTLSGVPQTTVSGSSSQDELRAETKAPKSEEFPYPAYVTAKTPWNRVAAVAGGNDFLSQMMTDGIKEYYLFDGDIPKDSTSGSTGGSGSGSSQGEHLRGYTAGMTPAIPLIDDLWYTRKGRLALLRPNLVAIGIGQPTDDQLQGTVTPPWPYLDGRFLGTVVCAYGRADQKQLSVWPKDGMTGVRTTGLDTDIAKLVNVSSGLTVDTVVPHAYGGPPISIVLPINVPFFLNPTNAIDGVTVGFRKLEVDPQTGANQAPPASTTSTYIMAMFAMPVSDSGGATQVVFTQVSQANDKRYQYQVVGATTQTTTSAGGTGTTTQNDAMRFGDLILIPTGPLEPSSWYEVAVRLRSSAGEFPGGDEKALEATDASEASGAWKSDGYYQFKFKTK